VAPFRLGPAQTHVAEPRIQSAVHKARTTNIEPGAFVTRTEGIGEFRACVPFKAFLGASGCRDNLDALADWRIRLHH
jgi:hypothetical protein